jgi:hypothetical protein
MNQNHSHPQDQATSPYEQAWAEWVHGSTMTAIGARRGVTRQAISQGIARYLESIPQVERTAYRERQLERYEDLYLSHAQAGKERPRVAAIVRAILDSECRLLGLVQSQVHVEHDGMVEHQWEPGPSAVELLERWRRDGTLRVRGEITRMDGGT